MESLLNRFQVICTVFDLPRVVSDLQGSKNLKYVGGDMFEAVPPADVILHKWTLHDWSDEDCVKILKQCKHAITSKGQQKVGKVIIIDIVRGSQNGEESNETQLLWDLEMMVTVTGLERNEMEWAKLFFDAGFISYKIHNHMYSLKSMELINEESASELLQAQTHVWNHIFNFINSMTLKCAVQLGIPDVIQEHGKPMTLSELVSVLPIHPSKAQYVHRLMRILVHSGFFSQQNLNQEAYSLTQSARLLLKDNPWSMRPLLLLELDPVLTKSWDCLSTWFQNDEATAFSVAHENTFWEYAGQDGRLNNLFNEAMASDSILASKLVVSKCKGIFEGVSSLVDVGGGLGTMAKGIAEAFPHMDCTVFDLPHVVSDLQGCKNLKYVGGDMFQAVPPAEAILLKGQKKAGKVIIIDMVRENLNGDEGSIETQLFFDLQMMVEASGVERNEKEWHIHYT
ncbi:trans-resveratrol di-O-methyltransferase-like [Populus alba x Populus x berolinensis]|uniref:Trans-resveratrol di-O-methyltransferase-like n=1 Tax=Populus alba x Populus x berolinensis TaxID=444605 RepID=A0AAD6LYN9_9ROSI|nr:trans-resveratrol di-O-methyltransferase-like [Populus alba x Populus x berolinensis]